MKPNIILTAVVILLLSSFAARAAADKRYSVKSGVVEYELSGSQQGIETLYFDQYGQKEARYTNAQTTVMGVTQPADSRSYLDGEWSYTYDEKTNIATRMNVNAMMEAFRQNPGGQSIKDFSEEFLQSVGGVKTGTKQIIGKTCDVWEIQKLGSTACIYKNSIPLESTANIMGVSITSTAKSIQENVPVPQDIISLPEGAQIQDFEMSAGAMEAIGQMPGRMPDIANMMQEMNEVQMEAEAPGLSEKELELRARELELKQRELELQEKQIAVQAGSRPQKSALDQANDAVNTTNKVKNTFTGLKSLLGR